MTRIEWRGAVRGRITDGMARCGVALLRINLGIVFFWFGVLKFFPGLSPAEDLAARTIGVLTFGRVGPALSLPLLALAECVIGVGLIWGRFLLLTIAMLFVQMLGTLTPLLLFPAETFVRFPYAATLEGQYIIKNLVLIAAAVVVGATADGGGLVGDPELVRRARAGRRRAAPAGTPPARTRRPRVPRWANEPARSFKTASAPAPISGA